MSKVVYENKKGIITITNRLSYPETVNERVYNAITSGMIEGLLPVSVQQKGKTTRIECTVRGLIPASQYFDGVVPKKKFLDFVCEITSLIKNCEKNLINANNIDLQKDRVFIDPATNRVKCIFWPIVNSKTGKPPHFFLEQLPADLKFNPYENSDYLHTYRSFFGGLDPFSINNFERMILTLIKGDGPNRRPATEEIDPGKKKEPEKNIEYDPFADLPVPEKKIIVKEEPPKNNTTECGGTTVFRYGGIESGRRMSLRRTKTGEISNIDKQLFSVGTAEDCDLCITGNRFVSRIHADIIVCGDRCYIVDRGSTNKTFVNGEVVILEQEVEVFSGTKIMFADEEFILNIE